MQLLNLLQPPIKIFAALTQKCLQVAGTWIAGLSGYTKRASDKTGLTICHGRQYLHNPRSKGKWLLLTNFDELPASHACQLCGEVIRRQID